MSQDTKTIADVLEMFAIATHQARPGQDETPNFNTALQAIEDIVRDVIGEKLSVSHAGNSAQFNSVSGQNMLIDKQLTRLAERIGGK